jgi:hypothetical protein
MFNVGDQVKITESMNGFNMGSVFGRVVAIDVKSLTIMPEWEIPITVKLVQPGRVVEVELDVN